MQEARNSRSKGTWNDGHAAASGAPPSAAGHNANALLMADIERSGPSVSGPPIRIRTASAEVGMRHPSDSKITRRRGTSVARSWQYFVCTQEIRKGKRCNPGDSSPGPRPRSKALRAVWVTKSSRTFSPIGVKLRKPQAEHMLSGLPAIADMTEPRRHFREVPISDIGQFIRSPHRRARAASAVPRGRAPWRS